MIHNSQIRIRNRHKLCLKMLILDFYNIYITNLRKNIIKNSTENYYTESIVLKALVLNEDRRTYYTFIKFFI
jgi:hypothetical protein